MNSQQRRRFRRSGVISKPKPAPKKQKPGPKPPNRFLNLGKFLWAAVVIGSVLLSYAVLKPDLAIEPYTTLDPRSPFGEQFSVENKSIYALKKVQPHCGLDKISKGGFAVEDLSVDRGEEFELASGGKANFSCPVGADSPDPMYGALDVSIVVDYKLPLGFSRCKTASFRGKPVSDGTYVWTYAGSPSCPHK